ncbi:Short-chain dehydrogenase, putative 3-oxoacyl-(Acyl-carrier-protein) reductase [Alloalcanivorax dieselolei B5]|uniref:Short-chain dehydrogenase, putative 3-oxoacyl-(Acyl-carrier-protein) reductase n=1 Tax=Alcanivorax dieselolei (strain DSM 16502 / CGMCC 1.3690 / MCCC 1A00001 / B-5) TaxID=930169 RepID=K0CG65_ALCDB|nr:MULTISPECIES: SDR family oxidoreductase [Alloalcanivorax]AFT71300.1 Short-chain dehydrogenase, putative 3-oxoacyl-(Acyl-carrier-protein) reductase [Alloalcanivorax dieselolei B5]MBA4721706.1 SDR family oxidoreductase [Alcanivorax sp.]GGJ94635.1 oxidoreductase [Alloalcanivorax dieselolei]CUR45594.1 3-oxoacyl-[acyl-carrier protein] reductase [Alloalcanivorax xenomutans]
MNIPEREINPVTQMFEEAIGLSPGRGRLSGRHVLVIGAGQRDSDDEEVTVGNGRAISILAAREGAKVACADINQASVEDTARRVREAGGQASAHVVDVSKPEQVIQLIHDAKAALGELDGLVLNVGISHGLPLDKITPESWDLEHAVNLRSHMLACQTALPLMTEGGAVVLTSSLASQRPTGRNPAYETSKAAQLSLCKSVAMAGHAKGIRCNAVAPGLMDTPMGRAASARRPNRAVTVPFGRQGTGWEVAYSMLFLLSHESSYVNGHALFVDGGLGNGIF